MLCSGILFAVCFGDLREMMHMMTMKQTRVLTKQVLIIAFLYFSPICDVMLLLFIALIIDLYIFEVDFILYIIC